MRYAIYALHLLFWLPYVVRAMALRGAGGPAVARRSPAGLYAHVAGCFVLYFGLGMAIVPPSEAAPVRWLVATAIIAVGIALSVWTLVTFRSWRLKPELTAGHQLSTDGPFAYVRHPIYAAMNLLSIGTAVWAPHPLVIAGALLVIVGSEWRARTEEGLLVEHFGDAYREYMRRVKRFVPGIY